MLILCYSVGWSDPTPHHLISRDISPVTFIYEEGDTFDGVQDSEGHPVLPPFLPVYMGGGGGGHDPDWIQQMSDIQDNSKITDSDCKNMVQLYTCVISCPWNTDHLVYFSQQEKMVWCCKIKDF